MQKNWIIKPEDKSLQERISKKLGIAPIVVQILLNRGIKEENDIRNFLVASLSSLHSPHLLKDMAKAVKRVKDAIRDGEKMLVFGDYDVDGITGVALLTAVLRRLKGSVISYIPNRIDEGYGLSMKGVEHAKREGAGLLITVDCGIGAKEEVEAANKFGIDTIVLDHHQVDPEKFPADAYAVINPLQSDCRYPFKNLSGVGLAYKLVQALTLDGECDVENYLDLVALGTVADIVPQIGENRILTRHGLARLSETENIGLRALMKVAGLKNRPISTRHVGFILGPRINAMGRVSSPEAALNLLLTQSEIEAAHLAKQLDTENRSRQAIESEILKDAIAKVEEEINFKHQKIIILESERWHPGVIGIVASRVMERFYRPAIMIAMDKEMGKGSGRSIENFHLFEAVSKCKSFLADFGGHKAACGITIHKKNLADFKEMINEVAANTLKADDLIPKLEIDMEISLSELDEDLIEQLMDLAPFGPANPQPVFASRNLKVKRPARPLPRNGIKLWLTDQGGRITCEAVGFGREDSDLLLSLEEGSVDLAYSPVINEWGGVTSIQLDIKDIRIN